MSATTVPAGGTAPLRDWRDLPHPPGWPLLGQLPGFDPLRTHLQLEDWARSLGTPYRFSMGPGYRALVFDDIELAQRISRERPQHFTRGGRMQPVMAEMGINGLFSVEGAAWQAQRRLIMQSLNSTHFKGWFDTLAAITQRLHRRWQRAAAQGRVLDMTDELKRYTVDVTSTLAFGEDINTLEQDGDRIQQQLALIFPQVMRRVMSPFSTWKLLRLPADRRLDRALQAVHAHAHGCVARARAHLADADPAAPRHALEAMLLQQQALQLGDDDIVANVLTLLLAGEDTTAHSLAWTLPYLAADRNLQARLHRQARAALRGAPVCPDHAALQQLQGFEHLALEALRLRPVVPFNVYEPVADTVVGDVRVRARTKLFFINRPALTDPARFADPQRYDPARWQAGTNQGAHDVRAFLAFGAGPRVCPGRHLATVEMRLVLSMLLCHFEVELATDARSIQEVNALTMMPDRMPVRLHPRGGG
jgi:cytochrome P450